jgi:hypothetical protein
MTTARAQPLAASELTTARYFLFEAHMLVTDVRSLFFNRGDGDAGVSRATLRRRK